MLLKNAYLVTVDANRTVIPSAWIRIADDRITGLGTMSSLVAQRGEEEIDLAGMLTMPGLVNGHNHHWASLFKNTGEGLYLEDWIDKIAAPLGTTLSPADLRCAAYLGAIEQLRTGTTCSLNHLTTVNDADAMAAIIEPVIELGVRQVVAKELKNAPQRLLPTRYAAARFPRNLNEEIALAESVVGAWDGKGGIVHMALAIEAGAAFFLHNATSDEVVVAGLELARRRNLKITTHCSAGTPWLSIAEFQGLTGGGDVDYLVRLGALTGNWILAHSLHLSDREIEHVARSGASVVTNPVSNAYSCDGILPLKRYEAAQVNVGLGTDGAYVNCSPDMVEQMKFLCLLQNATHFNPAFVTAEMAIEMATIKSAKALGVDHLIGSLEPGKKADIVAFDLHKAHTTVANRPIAALVFSAHGTDVDTVIVDGKVRLRQGELVGFDGEREVLAEANRRAREALARTNLSDKASGLWRFRQ